MPEHEEPVKIAVTNQINGRENNDVHINDDWTMEKVREKAYDATKDKPRPTDRFTCTDPNKDITGALLSETYEKFTLNGGFCPHEKHFYIRGPTGGA